MKVSALNTRLFRELCQDMDANHTALLFHTQMRWLSKEEGFVAQMAYLADIFETLNELDKKLQGKRSNVNVNTGTINAFMAKLQLWGKQMKKGNTTFSQRLSDIIDEKDIKNPLKEGIITHLDHLVLPWYQHLRHFNEADKVPVYLSGG
ncbi:protein FAM200B-like [Palaemon carinicauda]|uniref:protein FAM200B-like n=1 Tax=Palaemon carinicauda TaxID=392227 RepID=UPI0035B64095